MEQLGGSEAAPLARRLQRAMCTPDVQGSAPIGMNEELAKRELSILKRLESGLSNKEIAEAIFVSEGTLKWHLHKGLRQAQRQEPYRCNGPSAGARHSMTGNPFSVEF
jgi:ATP/maltotriose-dependent transcriptional regulator MalT